MKPQAVYSDLLLDDVAVERVSYDPLKAALKLTLGLENDKIVVVSFSSVIGLRMSPSICFDWSLILFQGSNVRTLFEVIDSEWITEIHAAEEVNMEPRSKELRHFLVPGSDSVWEILAGSCAI